MTTTRRKLRGFSLVELVIVVVIIGIIAAIAVPRISRGAKGAGDASLRATLAGLRNAIDMYAAEHGGTFPDGATQAAIEAQLVDKTDFNGTTSGTLDYGPYLRTGFPAIQVGENKGTATVKIIAAGSGDITAAGAIDALTAWIYSIDTGKIAANSLVNDGSGTPYKDY